MNERWGSAYPRAWVTFQLKVAIFKYLLARGTGVADPQRSFTGRLYMLFQKVVSSNLTLLPPIFNYGPGRVNLRIVKDVLV